jgi:hypothetical protein
MRAEPDSESSSSASDRTVRTAVDDIDGRPHVVVADVSDDGAWIAMPKSEAATLPEWR